MGRRKCLRDLLTVNEGNECTNLLGVTCRTNSLKRVIHFRDKLGLGAAFPISKLFQTCEHMVAKATVKF